MSQIISLLTQLASRRVKDRAKPFSSVEERAKINGSKITLRTVSLPVACLGCFLTKELMTYEQIDECLFNPKLINI